MTAPTLAALDAAAALARRSVQWLNAANGSGPLELALRLFKVSEEAGEVCEELEALNPNRAAVAREAVDVIATAMVAQVSLGGAPAPLPGIGGSHRLGRTHLNVLALRLATEAGKLAGTVIGEAGQNPRKGRHKTVADVIAQLDQVIAAAVVLIAGLGYDPEQTIAECVAKVQTRLDQLGVPALESGVIATDPPAHCCTTGYVTLGQNHDSDCTAPATSPTGEIR